MLWIALHFPQFRRQALLRGHALPDPEGAALPALAAWAGQFTPRISLEPPQALLLEVEDSLGRFGGRWKFFARLRGELKRFGFAAGMAEAATARAALWRARGDGGQLQRLPVSVLDLSADAHALLAGLGIHTVGGLMRQPRDGVLRRFGPGLLAQMDQAIGRVPETRAFFRAPEHFSERLALPGPVVQAEHALFVVRRLLDQLQGFLVARQAGIRGFTLDLLHPDRSSTRIRIDLAGPERDANHFTHLLRERFGALALKAPIEAVRLEASQEAFCPDRQGLFSGGRRDGDEGWLQFVDRVQARFGDDSVHGLEVRADHRPERASVAVPPGHAGQADLPASPRPLWLIEPPRPLAEGEFSLLAGPERIASGWWDGAEACRDYFIARIGRASLAWIYREREKGWFLHGYFA